MSKAIVLLWLAKASTQTAYEPDLDAWANARWAKLEAPVSVARDAKAYSPELVSHAEELLEQARIAAGALDDATALARLEEVEALLRAHPELPQAPWLMAERWHVAAGVAARGPDGAKSQNELDARARVLEGARAPTFGTSAPVPELVRVRVTLSGMGARDRVYFDAEPVTASTLDSFAGEHHVRVLRRDTLAWAGWVKIAPESHGLKLPVRRAAACSLEDLEGARIMAGAPEDTVIPPKGVRCRNWAVARPALAGGVEVATCHGSNCGPLIRWHRKMGVVYAGPPQPPPEPGFPAWATWTIAGASVLAAGAVVLWRSGAFDQPAPGHTRWTFQGPN